MANYDGSILINTKINVKSAEVQLSALENKMVKAADKVASLKTKMDAMKNAKVPTEGYARLQTDLEKAQAELSALVERQEQFRQLGVTSGVGWDELTTQIQKAGAAVDAIKVKMAEMEESGTAFVLGGAENTAEYAELARQLQYAENELRLLNEQHDLHEMKLKRAQDAYRRVGEAAKKGLSKANKEVKKSQGFIEKFFRRVKGLAERVFIFSFVTRFFRGIVNGAKEGFSNFAKYSDSFKSSIESLKSSLSNLGNSFASAFAPLVEIVIPYIVKLIDYISMLLGLVAQFTAAITGQKTYAKAVKQTAGAMKEAGKAAQGYLSPLDEINKFQKNDSGGSDAGGAGGMFEQVPISEEIQSMAENFKAVLANFFRPIKEAWDRQGKFVMDSWKYALSEVWGLVKDIGRDFLIVWNQEKTIAMFEDILRIVGDVGLVVGNLAAGLDEAWNKNQIGLSILENIRDIFVDIIGHIRNAADETVIWSENLDFYPLLESINNLLVSLEPLADKVGEGLEWFWTNILLPIAGWTIEDAVPTFLDMLSSALDALDAVLDALQPLGQWLWDEFLQPMGEWAGETVIDAMETITDLFEKFGDWVSEHQKEVENFAIILGSFAAAWTLVNTAVGIWNGISVVAAVVTGALGVAISFLTSPIGIVITIIGLLIAAIVLLYKNSETAAKIIKKTWEGIKKSIKTVVEGIVKIFEGIIEFLVGRFTLDWEKSWDGIVKILEGIGKVIKGIIDGILGFIGGLIEGIGDAVSGFGKLEEKSKSAKSYSESSSTFSSAPFILSSPVPQAFAALANKEFPGYATGQVIPRTMKEHLARFGDNNLETEVVSPLSTMKQAVTEAITDLGGIGGNKYDVKAYAKGRVLLELIIEEGKNMQQSTGNNPFLLK